MSTTAVGVSVLPPATSGTTTASTAATAAAAPSGVFQFGKFTLPASQVFVSTALSYGTVNLRPVVPGHVLIVSRRVVTRVADLKPAELCDLWLTAQRVSRMLSVVHASSRAHTFAIQDGAEAGQTVPHVHIHILPRTPNDFKRNDEIYERLEEPAPAASSAGASGKASAAHMDADAARHPPRTAAEMATEADKFRLAMKQFPSEAPAAE